MCDLFGEGLTIADVCAIVGISTETYYDWMRRGERAWKIDREKGYPDFSEAVKRARAEGRRGHVKNIVSASEKNWQASAWFLERSDPDHWARRDRHEVEHAGNLNIQLRWNDADPDSDVA